MDNLHPTDTGRDKTLAQIFIGLLVIVLLVNVPLSYRGTGLIQNVPEATAVVIYEGTVLRGSGPETYVLENHKLRPFSSPDTFDYFRKRTHIKVHLVDDSVLAPLAKGQPIRRLVKCDGWPDVYSLENGQKRPVKVSPHVDRSSRWDEVRPVVCKFLRAIPDGPPILDKVE